MLSIIVNYYYGDKYSNFPVFIPTLSSQSSPHRLPIDSFDAPSGCYRSIIQECQVKPTHLPTPNMYTKYGDKIKKKREITVNGALQLIHASDLQFQSKH